MVLINGDFIRGSGPGEVCEASVCVCVYVGVYVGVCGGVCVYTPASQDTPLYLAPC